MHGNRDLELLTQGIERMHPRVRQIHIKAVDVDTDPFEIVVPDCPLYILQALLDAVRVIAGYAH